MRLSREEVEHIALLARVGMTPEEVERYQEQLSNILENFQVLQQVNTQNVPPTSHSIAMENVMREDIASPSLPREDILANAPREEEALLRVRAVLEE